MEHAGWQTSSEPAPESFYANPLAPPLGGSGGEEEEEERFASLPKQLIAGLIEKNCADNFYSFAAVNVYSNCISLRCKEEGKMRGATPSTNSRGVDKSFMKTWALFWRRLNVHHLS